MRLTVDIPAETLNDLSRILKETKKSRAVAKAVAGFVQQEKARDFGRALRAGDFDYPTTNEAIEKLQG